MKTATTLGSLLPILATAAYTGSLTFYEPGLGACGGTNNRNDMIVAISHTLYDRHGGNDCGKGIVVSGPKGSATVTVVDRCAGCAEWDLDLSPAAWAQVVGDEGVGRTNGHWHWA